MQGIGLIFLCLFHQAEVGLSLNSGARTLAYTTAVRAEQVKMSGSRPEYPNGVSRFYPFGKYWNRQTYFNGNQVFQRNDLIDPRRVYLKTGETNLQLMQRGRAPMGQDGEPIILHHLIQTHEGGIAEVSSTFHRVYSNIIHINRPHQKYRSQIRRKEFDQWRREYWLNRVRDFK